MTDTAMTDTSMIGARIPRSDAEAKVRGTAIFGVDFSVPGTLHAVLLRSPVAAAHIRGIDATAAAALPGVHDVITGTDGPEWRTGVILFDIPFLATDYVAERYPFAEPPTLTIVTDDNPGPLLDDGIVISGMANPAKVLNFFDVAGTWDPSLGLVMAAAMAVATTGYWFVFRRATPIFEPKFHVPTGGQIDRALIIGSLVFGVGWGIAGFCPGGVLPVISTGNPDVLTFIAAMVVGMLVARPIRQRLSAPAVARPEPAQSR
jgi:uncharacterized membrane protein YedE/YeeE